MKKIGDKSWILSPITGFQMQKLFRKPSDSSPQEPATTSNNSLTKVSLRWRGNLKVGSIKLSIKLPIVTHKFPNGTCATFVEFSAGIDVLQVLCDGRAFRSEKIGNLLLGEPNRILLYSHFQSYRFIR